MSLGFILGDATKNHRQVLLEQITNWQAEDPQAKIYYILFPFDAFILDSILF